MHYLVYVRQSYRRSGANADADVSPEAQAKAARAALPRGATCEVIADSGGHRSGRTEARDGYQALIRRLSDPGVAGVAVYDLSRLARNARLMLNLKHELDRRDLHLVVSNLPDSRFDTAVGRFLFGQLCLAAQFQADVDSERMVGITRAKHERGGHNGADPLGYRAARDELGRVVQPHRLEVVPEEADLVREVFDRYGAGDVSQGRLAEALRAEGLDRRGRPWVEKGVQDVLRRADLYLGRAVYRRGQDVREGTHEPIITPAQAHLARQAAARRRRSTVGRQQRGRVYLLAQLLHCACGLRMRGETHVRRGRSEEWRYYRCPGRRDGRCASRGWRIRADAVEAIVLGHLAAHRTPPEELPYLREELARLTHLPDDGLRGRRARIETAMKRLGDRYTWQEIEEAEYRAERRKLEAMLVELPLPAESNLVAFDRAAALYEEIGAILADTTVEHQRQIVLTIVEGVTVAGGEVKEIRVRPEARPFFGDYVAEGEDVVGEQGELEPAVGWWRPRTDSNRRRAP